jgi:serpin B
MIMILLNAVYFKGIWTTKFRKSMTDLLPFYTGEGEKLHPLMFRRDDIQYTQTETAQVVRLPFGQNERVSLYVLLPLKGMRQALGTGDVLATLNQLTLSGMRQRLFQEDVQLWLPRVESEYESTLNGSLAEMGMPSAFSGSADFSGMRPIPPVVKIDEVRHKTFFKMDEKGAEAAAVTSVSMTLECCIQRDEVVMRVDRPFVTLIVDDTTGTLLFAGVINNPEWKSADEGSDEDEEENTDESGDMDGSPALPGPDNPCLIDPDSIGGREESFEEGDEILE